jgi:hypothetical protein
MAMSFLLNSDSSLGGLQNDVQTIRTQALRRLNMEKNNWQLDLFSEDILCATDCPRIRSVLQTLRGLLHQSLHKDNTQVTDDDSVQGFTLPWAEHVGMYCSSVF